MPKYYLQSGNMRVVVNKDTVEDACAALAIKWINSDMYKLGDIILISEQGFDDVHGDDVLVNTKQFLEESGIKYIDLRDDLRDTEENEDSNFGNC